MDINTHFWCGLCDENSAQEGSRGGARLMWAHLKDEHTMVLQANEATFETLRPEGPDDEGRYSLRFENGDEAIFWHPYVVDDD